MRRRWKILIAVVVVLIAAGVVAWFERPQDHTDPVSINEAVTGFRHDGAGGASGADGTGSTAAPEDVPGFPPSGVYTYSVEGEEQVSLAIFGQTHPYHGVASMTIVPSGCGVRETLRLLTTRWNETVGCKEGSGVQLVDAVEHHEFYGTTSDLSYRCARSPSSVGEYRAGSSWTTDCKGSGGTLRLDSEVIGTPEVSVGDERVPAVEIKSTARLAGEVTGTTAVLEWRRPEDGLLLKRIAETNTDVDILGGGTYEEAYTVSIESLKPRR
jgi:hypothetical protein